MHVVEGNGSPFLDGPSFDNAVHLFTVYVIVFAFWRRRYIIIIIRIRANLYRCTNEVYTYTCCEKKNSSITTLRRDGATMLMIMNDDINRHLRHVMMATSWPKDKARKWIRPG